MKTPSHIDRRAGDDLLNGGRGPNVLIGGSGNDLLLGGQGHDILIGGAGFDILNGGGDDDLLIAGRTTFDTNYAALLSLQAKWNSPRLYAERVQNLSGVGAGPRLNDDNFLVLGETVFDDAEFDLRIGASGRDSFFVEEAMDMALRHHDEVFANELDEILMQ